MRLGKESSDGGWLGRGTLILSMCSHPDALLFLIRRLVGGKIQLNKILKAVHGKKKRYCIFFEVVDVQGSSSKMFQSHIREGRND